MQLVKLCGGFVFSVNDVAVKTVNEAAGHMPPHAQGLAAALRGLGKLLEHLPTEAWDDACSSMGLLSAFQVAGLLRLSDIAVANWLHGGYFPGAIRTPSGQWWFDPTDVAAVRSEMARLRKLNTEGKVEIPDLGDTEPDVPVF